MSSRWPLRRATANDYDRVLAVQQAAYAHNRRLLGVEPIPLQVDYHVVLRDKEVWLALDPSGMSETIQGVLILEPRANDMMIESIATDPLVQGHGLGRFFLAVADAQAKRHRMRIVRLYTGSVLAHLIAWYGRHGYVVEHIEVLSDRSITHMMKQLPD